MSNRRRHTDLLESTVRGKLSRLRVGLRARLAVEGVCWILLAAVLAVFATLAFDYLLRLERPLRAAALAAALTAVGWVAWRRLVLPLTMPMTADALALLVEQRHRGLGDRLISALQLERLADPAGAGMSPAMVRQVAREANELAGPLPFAVVIERARLVKSASLAALAVVGLGVFATAAGDTLDTWFRRNVLLDAGVEWPQNTYLRVTGASMDPNGDFTVLRGDDLAVEVHAEGVAPPQITLHARYPSFGSTEEVLELVGDGTPRYRKTFPAVSEPLTFHVTGGDDRRDRRRPHRVRLIDPPALRSLTFSIEYPDYQKRRTEAVDGSTGVLSAPRGSWIHLAGTANKDLASGEVVVLAAEGSRRVPLRIRTVDQADALGVPRGLLGRFAVAGSDASANRTLKFALTDTQGYTSRRGQQYLLQVAEDVAPAVDLVKYAVTGTVTPTARIPLRVDIKDDHGLAGGAFLAAVGEQADANARPLGEPLEPDAPGREQLRVRRELDLSQLDLSPGDTLRLMCEARDNLPAELGGPNRGVSAALTFRIVKPDELMAQLVKRQKEIRESFMQAIAQQATARAKTLAAGQLARAGQVSAETRRLLGESATLEGSVASEIVKTIDGLAGVLAEMRYNNVGSQEDLQHLGERIIEPLRQLAEPLETTRLALEGSEAVTEPVQLADQAQALADAQGEILREMETIAERMQKLASRQELANEVLRLMKWTDDWVQRVRRMEQQKTTTIWDDLEADPNQP